MNKNEFLQMKNEFAEYIYRYEYFVKCGAINDLYYNHYFGRALDEVRFYELENNLMVEAIRRKNNNESLEEINKFIEGFKEKFNNENKTIEEKHQLADQVVEYNEKLTVEEKKQFEEDYLAYVKANHPIVKVIATQDEDQIFSAAQKYYNTNNIKAFKDLMEASKEAFTEVEYKEEDYTKISAYYYDIKKNINQDYMNKQNNYPFNKMDVLKNEISIARETGDIKVRKNKLAAANKEIHKDYIENFGEDLSLR